MYVECLYCFVFVNMADIVKRERTGDKTEIKGTKMF